MGQGLGVGGSVEQGPGQAGWEKGPRGAHGSGQAGKREELVEFLPRPSSDAQPGQRSHLCGASRVSFLPRAWSAGGGELMFLTGGGVTSAMGSLAPGSWSEVPLSVFLHLALRFWNQT